MIPPIADGDPDPTTQIPWPARGQVEQAPAAASGSTGPDRESNGDPKSSKTQPGKQLSNWDLITLSISMAGAQIAWTVELG